VCPITVLPCSSRTGTSPRPPARSRTHAHPGRPGPGRHRGRHPQAHPHRRGLTAATGQILATHTVPTTPAGYETLRTLADQHPGPRIWAIEGTGGYGAGLVQLLAGHDEWVVELDRPARPARRHGAKSDALDAVRAAREALGRDRLAQPRAGGRRAALGMLLAARRSAVDAATCAQQQLQAMVVTAPPGLRAQVSGRSTRQLIPARARLRGHPSWEVERRTTALVLRALARRVLELEAEAHLHHQTITSITRGWRPDLLAELGVGPITAATVLGAWSHPGRCPSEAAFAMLGGAAPIPASSGQTVRVRLNRSGDRQLNRALHVVVLTRLRHDPATQAYAKRRRAQGKTDPEIKRCLKRYVARQLYRLLEADPALDTT
jgi:transposase